MAPDALRVLSETLDPSLGGVSGVGCGLRASLEESDKPAFLVGVAAARLIDFFAAGIRPVRLYSGVWPEHDETVRLESPV